MQRHLVVGLVLPAVVAAVCQVFAFNPAPAQGAEAGGAGIFIPKPRGSEDSFDPNAVAVQPGTAILGRAGDRLTGSVNSIANGVVRFSGPFFDQEVGIFTEAIREIRFPPGNGSESGRDLVVLTNDDRLFGKIEGMTAADVAFESAAAGFVKISKRRIKQMWFHGSVDALARTNFANGQPSPLQVAGSSWQVAGGALHISSPAMATVPLGQSSAVTVVMDFAHMGQIWDLSLFADQAGRGEGEMPARNNARGGFGLEGNAVSLALAQNGFAIVVSRGSDQPLVPASGLPAKPGEAQEVRFAYDPAGSEVKFWINGQIVNESKGLGGPKQGRYVVFSSFRGNCDLKSFTVLDGVVAPGKIIEEADPSFETIFYQSGEHSLHAQSIELADGVFSVQTNFADKPLSIPAEKVVSVSTSQAERETAPPPEHPVQICLPKSILTVDLVELTAKTAVARSPYLGDIKIVRDMIQSMHFLTPAPAQ